MSVKMLLYMTLSLWIMRTVVFAIRLSKPNCPESSGNVKIPFPFGIGQECSANSSFTIDCRNFTNFEIPFLSSLNLEVLEVNLTQGLVVTNQPVSPMNCSSEEKYLSLGKSLLETPFIFPKFYNVLMVLGCKNVVSLVTNNKIAGGCMAICGSSGYNLTDTDCNGLGCCKIDIPEQLKEQQIIYSSTDTSTDSFCGYAFLVEDYWFRNNSRKYKGLQDNLSNPFDKEFVHAPVALGWEFPIADLDWGYCNYRLFSYSFGTQDYSYTKTCKCRYGFEGNPYLEKGCQDIDECMDPTLNHCGNVTCINVDGYYRCGKKSCVKMALIGIGAGLGALVLLVGAWKSYKGSSVQDNLGDTEPHSIIEVSEVYDFASISGSINFDNITIPSTSEMFCAYSSVTFATVYAFNDQVLIHKYLVR
ncbi:unnamed protein product [Fraxinus pennsylvanica]|uniref:Wall-associated receptor kinase galacturonan-binding domain-containing protein n=1 Tax=Fraxinus pennsylvanica TaxID=56036 RepID=A0AAD1YR44_9LAMI|nr:unnamed protein product [Fraxinus pennsylvanica]